MPPGNWSNLKLVNKMLQIPYSLQHIYPPTGAKYTSLASSVRARILEYEFNVCKSMPSRNITSELQVISFLTASSSNRKTCSRPYSRHLLNNSPRFQQNLRSLFFFFKKETSPSCNTERVNQQPTRAIAFD
jgi:hypothetical protein